MKIKSEEEHVSPFYFPYFLALVARVGPEANTDMLYQNR